MIRMYGPPLAYWTGRFESKHRIAKNTAETAKNVINITKTISERHQMRVVSILYNGMFPDPTYNIPEHVLYKHDIKEDSDFHVSLKSSMGSRDFICDSIFVNYQNYKNRDLVVVSIKDSDNICVGIIMSILVKENKVYFVVKKYKAKRNWLQFFQNISSNSTVFEFIDCNRLVDYKPLIMRGTVDNFIFTLHHHVSFDYQ